LPTLPYIDYKFLTLSGEANNDSESVSKCIPHAKERGDLTNYKRWKEKIWNLKKYGLC